jgi:putative transposase
MYKIHYLLKPEYGIDISCGRVYRLMKQMNLPPISTKKPNYSVYNAQNEYENLLKRQFNQLAPDTVWVSDITYIKVS